MVCFALNCSNSWQEFQRDQREARNMCRYEIKFTLKSLQYTGAKKYWHPYLINTIEMRSLWMKIKHSKSSARLLDRDWVNKGGLDLSKEVLWVSVGQNAADIQTVKVGDQKTILPNSQVRTRFARNGPIGRIFFDLQLLQPVDLLPFDLQRPTVPL